MSAAPRVAMIDLRRRFGSPPLGPRVAEVVDSGTYVGGPVVAEAEQKIAVLLGRAHGVGVASGTDALVLALQALGVGVGDEVIVPAVSFFATAGAVVRAGARPVFVDVLPDRPLLDPDAARQARTSKTKAVVVVHLYGAVAPHPDLGLPVVDDVAQAVGGLPARGHGRVAAASFYPTKVLGCMGDGGGVFCDDASLAADVRLLTGHGRRDDGQHHRVGATVGCNSRLDAVQAAILLEQLPGLPARLERRRAIADRYDAILGDAAVPRDPGSPVSVYAFRHPHRDALARALADVGIDTAVYYPKSLGSQPAFGGGTPLETPQADRFCDEVLALPCHGSLRDDEVERVCAGLEALA